MQIEELTRVLWLRRCGAQLQTLVSVPDITLPTKVCLVKAMVFSAAMYGCASCTMKKTEHRRTDAFELWCWRTGCWSPLDCKEVLYQLSYKGRFLLGWLNWCPCCSRDCQESSPKPQFKSISSLALSFLYGPILISIHDYWKNHMFDYIYLCWSYLCFLICCPGFS